MKKSFLLVILFLCSCQKENAIMPEISPTPEANNVKTDGMTVLGRQLENPYSVENMRKALRNLVPATRSGITDDAIQTTHYYVKFKPKNQQELDMIKRDSTINWYDIPLDYEIEQYGTYYHDPSVPDTLPTYQYASIEVAKWSEVKEIAVNYEILSELFIPDEDKDKSENPMTRVGNGWNEELTDALVEESLRITGNDETDYDTGVQTRARSKWRPAGRITYYDDQVNRTIGLEGIKVKARRWFTTHTGFVDANGYYSCDGRFKRPANYSFDFERYEFHVKGDGVKTDFDGPKKTGNWDYHFARTKSQPEYFGATVFRAAYHYYYKDIGGLRRPPQNSFWKTQMKLKVHNQNNDSSNGNFNSARRFLGMGSAIKLYNPGRKTVDIYATTIHELSHAAHWRMIVKEPDTKRYRDYHNAEDKMVESWATGVQWYLTRMVYTGYRGRSQGTPNYTNVVIDLVDSRADDGNNNGKKYEEGDKVEGYTIAQIETALIGCNTWNKWRDNIKGKYDNKTKQYVDELFATW
ncbi:hypothetical protein [Alistipes finegoldii]|uniref:hypothetical protein n=1 Tax=Alistipes finegoldii TaxID=214856 RepID=UPI00242F08BF|nr:hypothetical protein [Alistipes finegoldii]